MRNAMEEWRITGTFVPALLGEEAGEQVLRWFADVAPDTGPVVSQNFEEGTMSVTFACEAEGPGDALLSGERLFEHGLSASGVQVAPARRFEVELVVVDDDDADAADELQPAQSRAYYGRSS
jgi:hypothetical protein